MAQNKFNDIIGKPSQETNNAPEESEESPRWTPSEEQESTDSLPPEAEEIAWPTSDSDPAPVVAMTPRNKRGGLLRVKAYLPEFVVMLFVLSWLVYGLNTLVSVGIDSLIPNSPSTDSYSSYTSTAFSSFSAFELVWALSITIISGPLFFLLFARTKKAEKEAPLIKDHRWRKAALATFLVINTLGVVGILVALAFDLLSRMISPDGLLGLLGAGSMASPWWQVTIVAVLNAALLGFVVFMMSNDYRSKEGN
jgi:hypothetical protein